MSGVGVDGLDVKISGDLEISNQKLLDALVMPIVTPSDPSDDDILANLERLVVGEIGGVSGEMTSIRLLLGIRKAVKSAERVIFNGYQRKEAIIYVCKMAIIKNAKDIVVRDTLLLLVDEVVPEVIEMVVDAAKNPEEYKQKLRKGIKGLCLC